MKTAIGFSISQNGEGYWITRIAQIRSGLYPMGAIAGPFDTARAAFDALMPRGLPMPALVRRGPIYTMAVASPKPNGKWRIHSEATERPFFSEDEALNSAPGLKEIGRIPIIEEEDVEWPDGESNGSSQWNVT